MPREFKNLETAEPFTRLLACIVSKEGEGKSWLITTARKPIFIFDLDGRADSLPRTRGVYAITYRDPSGQDKQPTVISDFLNDLTLLEGCNCDVGKAFPHLNVPPGTIAKTVAFDSGTWLAKAAMKYSLYANSDLARVITIGGSMKVRLTKSFDGWNSEMQTVEQCIARGLALPTLPDFIITFHEDAEEAPGSTGEKKIFTGRYSIFPARYGHVPSVFNDVWRVKMVPGKKNAMIYEPEVQVRANDKFTAKTSMAGLDTYEPGNIMGMIEKHIKSGKGQVNSLDTVALTQPALLSNSQSPKV